MRSLLGALAALFLTATAALAQSAGTLPIAMVQQFNASGQPLAGCLVYFFQAGTVATPTQAYQDFGLTNPISNPAVCDQSGRVPMFWLPSGLVHVRLTDSSGVVQIDTTMQVLGPSSGSGGGGSTVDPTTIAATGDIKYRATNETLTGWVVLNGQTIGSASSGASQRANADTQNLFVYLWTNCASPSSNNHCQVVGGLGASALADFQANKKLTLPDMRDKDFAGRDCMGNTCAGGILSGNIGSGGSDTPDTAAAWGGSANQTTGVSLSQANLPNVNFAISGISVVNNSITASWCGYAVNCSGGGNPTSGAIALAASGTASSSWTVSQTNVAVNNQGSAASGGSGTPATTDSFPVMNPFLLVTVYMKL